MESKGKIHEAIAAIMAEVGGVKKGRTNQAQNYSFRGIADLYLACQPLMAKHGVHLAPYAVLSDHLYERQTKHGGFQAHVRQTIEFRFYHADGSWFPCTVTGEAMDTGDKASNKAMSVAAKYALIQTFAIPEEDPDVDTENSSPEPLPRGKEQPTPKAAAPSSPPSGPRLVTSDAPSARPSDETPAQTTEHPMVSKAKEMFGLAAPAKDEARAKRVVQLMIGTRPQGLGWAKPHAANWLLSLFGTKDPFALDGKQQITAENLLIARRDDGEDTYNAMVEQYRVEKLVLPEKAK